MMETLYVAWEKTCDVNITLPSPMFVGGMGVAVMDVKGYFVPRDQNETYFLCCDFAKSSYMQPTPLLEQKDEGTESYNGYQGEMKRMPILRRLRYKMFSEKKKGDVVKVYGGRFDESYGKPLFYNVTRDVLDDFRMYITDSRGVVPSFDDFQLCCTLLFVKK